MINRNKYITRKESLVIDFYAKELRRFLRTQMISGPTMSIRHSYASQDAFQKQGSGIEIENAR